MRNLAFRRHVCYLWTKLYYRLCYFDFELLTFSSMNNFLKRRWWWWLTKWFTKLARCETLFSRLDISWKVQTFEMNRLRQRTRHARCKKHLSNIQKIVWNVFSSRSIGRQLKSENRLDADVEEEIFELTGTPVSRTGGHQTEINFHQRYLVMLLQRYRYHMLTGSVTHII